MIFKKKTDDSEKLELLEKRVVFLEEKVNLLEAEVKAAKEKAKSSAKKKSAAKKKTLTPEEKAAERKEKSIKKNLGIVVERTGWTMEQALENFNAAEKRVGCTPTEYMLYKLYELTGEQQDEYLLVKHQSILHNNWDVNREFIKMLRDKERTNAYFAEFIKRPWCVNIKVDFEKFKEIFKDSDRIIYKPISGHCGYGVEAFDLTDDEKVKEAYDKLSTYPEGVVEEYIVQHPDMMKLCPSSVNSLRIVTISSNTKKIFNDGKNYDIVYAGLRIGQGKAIVDNLHSGGMVANVDLETGKLINNAADCTGKVFVQHPDTGMTIKGFEIPCFKEAVNMVIEAIEKNNIEGYIGWDIAISEKGPMFLEVNGFPGVVVLQTATAQEGKGMRYVMDKYL